MPVGVNVTVGVAAPKRLLREYARQLPRAETRSLNEVAKQVKTLSAREIKKERQGLRIGVIKKSLKLIRATFGKRRAVVQALGAPIPLRDYQARGVRKGVSVKVVKRRKIVRGAFFVEKFGRHVFRRKGRARLPIKKLFGPSIPTAMIKRGIRRAQERLIRAKWPEVFTRNLHRLTARGGRETRRPR